MILQRIERLLAALEAMGAEGCMLHAPENMRYFSGYTGEGLILLGREGRTILTDSRYTEQAVHQAPDYQVVEYNAALPFERAVREAAEALKVQRLGFENGCVSVAEFERLKLILEGFTLLPVNDRGMQLRAVKDAGEIEAIRRVCQVTDDAYEALKTMIRPGVSELDVVAELGYYLQKRHHTRMAFCIVASGENGSMPHAIASERLIRANEAVTVDFGGILDGYQSDMTRTFAVGRLSDTMAEIYQVVLDAQLAAVDALAPGKTGREVDAVARTLIEQAGYGAYFGHGLGHGVGLMGHEAPRLSPASNQVLEPGMVVTVEPGIYLPGIGGVRIEDTCLVTETGCEVLFTAPKALQMI